jgi:hypothetical protein
MRSAVLSLLFASCHKGGSPDDCYGGDGVIVDGEVICGGGESDADTDTDSDTDTDPHDPDADGDGLSDWDEKGKYGTDPNNPDTDGDGYGDGEEIADGTSPTNRYSHGYEGDYNVGACNEYPDKANAHPTGSRVVNDGGAAVKIAYYQPGDRVQNFRLVDQFGEEVDLYSFCGKYVDLLFFQYDQLVELDEYAALSCWIQDMKNVHSYYRDYGYELIAVVTQNSLGHLPTPNDVAAVSAMLGMLDNPVLASADESLGSLHSLFEMDFHEPTLVHLGPELQVLSVDNDDCAGSDRDPCPYMGDWVPDDLCWDSPDVTCEELDAASCACPAPACKDYCGDCPNLY